MIRIVQRLKPASGEQAARMELAIDMRYPESTKNIGYFPLGWVAEKYKSKVAIGETREMRIFTHRGVKVWMKLGEYIPKELVFLTNLSLKTRLIPCSVIDLLVFMTLKILVYRPTNCDLVYFLKVYGLIESSVFLYQNYKSMVSLADNVTLGRETVGKSDFLHYKQSVPTG